jgi:uncharacterized damage-inducible protein DinB
VIHTDDVTVNADNSAPNPDVPPSLRVPRPDESTLLDELTMLRAWLEHLRGSAEYKLEGLDYEQLRWKPGPTANSLGGIVMHMGYGERMWLRVIFAGEKMDLSWTADRYAPTFLVPDGWGVEEVLAFFRTECANADGVLDAAQSLDEPSKATIRPTTLRWILTHMVEETARHMGHMDITRELIDGRIGR